MISPVQLERLRKAARRLASADPAHDWLHVTRVEHTAGRIAEAEGAATTIVRAAATLHEVFSYPKDHPDSHRSGERCAEVALSMMRDEQVDEADAQAVAECIRVHPFSAGITPATLEARVLQDADRLDAIGAIGVARCFATCAKMNRPFYDEADPFALRRDHDDRRFGVDHFHRKLLRIGPELHTKTAHAMAASRHRFLEAFLQQLDNELR
jgi:uncharacterized protein